MTDKCWGVYAVEIATLESYEVSDDINVPVYGTFPAKDYTEEVYEYELNCSHTYSQEDDTEYM